MTTSSQPCASADCEAGQRDLRRRLSLWNMLYRLGFRSAYRGNDYGYLVQETMMKAYVVLGSCCGRAVARGRINRRKKH